MSITDNPKQAEALSHRRREAEAPLPVWASVLIIAGLSTLGWAFAVLAVRWLLAL